MRPLVFLFSFLATLHVYGQTGPAGVSNDVSGDSDCKIWLDASSITAADNTTISSWQDESPSAIDNSPFQGNASLQPTFRNNVSAGINGKPILQFTGGKYLLFSSTADINIGGPVSNAYVERSTLAVFRTGSDVTTRQVIYEQGGNARGLNMYIFNDTLWVGGYDFPNDADGTPSWGFTAAQEAIQPNTTYVVAHLFDGPAGATTGTITGFLNGEPFSIVGNSVGSLTNHPNAPGMGAVNGQTIMEGVQYNTTGGQVFLGDFAEFISYEDLLNDAERILIENYLGAKYNADTIQNDLYNYQLNYGSEVIGVAQIVGATNRHNQSKGRNLFQIEVDDAEFDNNESFLVGHNGSTTAWTTTNAPNNGVNMQRTERIWRADYRGNLDSILFTVDISELPTLPSGYTAYGLAIDNAAGIAPNFNSTQTVVQEFQQISGNTYQIEQAVSNGAFITLVAIRPEVRFENASSFTNETETNFAYNVTTELNFIPAQTYVVDYSVAANTATTPADYLPGATVTDTFEAFSQQSQIAVTIVGDAVGESTENFTITLSKGANTSVELNIGSTATHTVTIYDNDNTSSIGFDATTATFNENAGGISLQVNRTGDVSTISSVSYRLRASNPGDADSTADFTYTAGTLNFGVSQTTATIPLTLTDDAIDEDTESFFIELYNNSGSDLQGGAVEMEVSITDNDAPPTV